MSRSKAPQSGEWRWYVRFSGEYTRRPKSSLSRRCRLWGRGEPVAAVLQYLLWISATNRCNPVTWYSSWNEFCIRLSKTSEYNSSNSWKFSTMTCNAKFYRNDYKTGYNRLFLVMYWLLIHNSPSFWKAGIWDFNKFRELNTKHCNKDQKYVYKIHVHTEKCSYDTVSIPVIYFRDPGLYHGLEIGYPDSEFSWIFTVLLGKVTQTNSLFINHFAIWRW